MSARLENPGKRVMEPKMRWVRLERGPFRVPAERINAHTSDWCEGEICCIHNPTDHSMRSFRQHWRDDRQIMERVCSHGIGHPDPDDLTVRLVRGSGIHGCDGCCRG